MEEKGIVDSQDMFFFSLEILYIIPGHLRAHTFYK